MTIDTLDHPDSPGRIRCLWFGPAPEYAYRCVDFLPEMLVMATDKNGGGSNLLEPASK